MTLYAFEGMRPTTPADGNYFVAPGAHVIGDVRIGSQASIWFGCTLRGDNEPIILGDGVNVQENCVLHTDMGFPLTLGCNASVGHKAMLHGCTIGEGAVIGMGATVLNGAVIGAGSLVGAGALVAEGKEIPPGVLVLGTPGRVVRKLTEADQKMIAATALHYQERMTRYRSGLTVIE